MTDIELENARKHDDYREQKEDRQWEKEFEREQRQNDADWNVEQRRRAVNWDDKEREAQMRREDEEIAYNRRRQDKYDDIEIVEREANISQRRIQAMMEIDAEVQINKDNVEATMSAEALMAKQAAQLGSEGQVALAQALGSGKENELLMQMVKMKEDEKNQNKQDAKEWMQMMMNGMMNMGQLNATNQQAMNNMQQQHLQQRYDDQKARADEYKQDAYRQQDRMDAASQQALDFSTRSHQTDSQSFAQAMGAPNNFQAQPQYQQQMQPQYQQPVQPQYQQPMQPQYQQPAQPQYQQPVQPQYQQPVQSQPAPKAGSRCPNCGAPVEPGDNMCGECGSPLQ
jgi:hypothetical protein